MISLQLSGDTVSDLRKLLGDKHLLRQFLTLSHQDREWLIRQSLASGPLTVDGKVEWKVRGRSIVRIRVDGTTQEGH